MPLRHAGFSLVELAVAAAVLAILATLAAPGFGSFLRDCRRTATLNALTHAVHAARTAAAAGGTPQLLCGTHDARSCSGSLDWSAGVLRLPAVAADATESGPGAAQVHVPSHPERISVRSNRSAIRFEPLAPAATTATLTVCDDRGAAGARALIVSRTGRPRTSDRDASGRALVCP